MEINCIDKTWIFTKGVEDLYYFDSYHIFLDKKKIMQQNVLAIEQDHVNGKGLYQIGYLKISKYINFVLFLYLKVNFVLFLYSKNPEWES